MAQENELEGIVKRECVRHSIDEIPAILREYNRKGTTSLDTYLRSAKDKKGKRHYSWVEGRFKLQSEFDDIFEWLRSILPKHKSLIKQAEKLDEERRVVEHSIDEIPGILKKYIKNGTVSLATYLSDTTNKKGKHHYNWINSRFRGQEKYADMFGWLHALFPKTPEYKETHDLIDEAKKNDEERKRLSYSVEDIRIIVGTVLKHRGSYTAAAEELGYTDHSAISHQMEKLYSRYPLLAEVVYLVAIGNTHLRGKLQEIHYRKLDEGLRKVEAGELTKYELARQLGYKSHAGLGMLIKSREKKTLEQNAAAAQKSGTEQRA